MSPQSVGVQYVTNLFIESDFFDTSKIGRQIALSKHNLGKNNNPKIRKADIST